jgi:hypothetical protein
MRNPAPAAEARPTALPSRAQHAESPYESACAVAEPAPSEAEEIPTLPIAPTRLRDFCRVGVLYLNERCDPL